ncbi:MAG: ornithine cyclodeaminase family protein [candidate division Zixibacteria bacterium]|nr:ornithine cyclodeaminase family protein [candidate division Zixibacteria bacterium]
MAILLNRQDVAELLTMKDTIDILEKAFIDYKNGQVDMPVRLGITAPDYSGLSLYMPCYLKGLGALGIKTVTVFKDNPAKFKMPTVMGTITLLDEKTGNTLAIMDGGYLTGMRTGAVAGLASKFMANDNSSVMGLLGAGVMAKFQLRAVAEVIKLSKVKLFAIDEPAKINEFKSEMEKATGVDIEIVDSAEKAVHASDIVTLITSSKDPVINGSWLSPGTHINGVGSHAPTFRELDVSTIKKSKIVCDSLEACRAEAGDFIIPFDADEIDGSILNTELGDVVTGKKIRESDSDITLFKSVGLALQDISVANFVYQKAVEKSKGVEFNF